MISVTHIERFAIHDGPGIRTTVFLKGCTLCCPWCANPETQSSQPVLLHDMRKCVSCHTCEQSCPQKAIHFQKGRFHHDAQRCNGCQSCVEMCLQDALQLRGEDMESEAILHEVMKDKDYYDMSHGGVTFSGGEPFVQVTSLCEILQEAKALGLHTAVETTGNYPLADLQRAEPFIDLFLYDFKHLDDAKLLQFTHGNGQLIKTNLAYLLHQDVHKVIVRMPIITGFNDEASLVYQELDYLHALGVQSVHLLPYHSLGKSKAEQMGKPYVFPTEIMANEVLEPYRAYALAKCMYAQIGG